MSCSIYERETSTEVFLQDFRSHERIKVIAGEW